MIKGAETGGTQEASDEERRARLTGFVEREPARGPIRIAKDAGLFVARRDGDA